MDEILQTLGTFGYSRKGVNLGALGYVDDILSIDTTDQDSTIKTEQFVEWVTSWGGEVNFEKTVQLRINNPDTETIKKVQIPVSNKITYLGMQISSEGVESKASPGYLSIFIYSIRAMCMCDGMAPAGIFNLLKTVAWPKISYGLVVTLPDLSSYIKEWMKACRTFLFTFKTVSTCVIIRESGLKSNPAFLMMSSLD
eukprot:Filipodium_phascolosomae@DN2585_c0_g1_i10.p1